VDSNYTAIHPAGVSIIMHYLVVRPPRGHCKTGVNDIEGANCLTHFWEC